MWGYFAAGAAALFAASWAFARGRVEGVRLGLQADELLAKAKGEAEAAMPRGTPPAMASANLKPSPADVDATEKWTAVYFGSGIPLATRMNLMRDIIPLDKWPAYAVRVARWLVRLPGGL